jgi:ATP-dependent 26S proteasome regulatory subunit
VAGLESLIRDLRETVIAPIIHRKILAASQSKLTTPPKGVLLHGPPGQKDLLNKKIQLN